MSTKIRDQPIFVAYAGSDRSWALKVHRQLLEAGFRPWCDAVDLVPGDRWDETIPAILAQAAAVLVLISEGWAEVGETGAGWYGPEEVSLAIDRVRQSGRRTRIIPVLRNVGPERVPYGLRRIKAILLHDDEPLALHVGRMLADEDSSSHVHDQAFAIHPKLEAARARVRHLELTSASPEVTAAALARMLTIKRELRSGGQLSSGDMLGQFILGERIGHGGFASVWEAWDSVRQRRVAVKVLHGRWNRDSSHVERFSRGCVQMSRLRHPHIIEVLETVREDSGWYYFAMEYADSGNLQAAVLAGPRLSVTSGLGAILEVAEALGEAHRRGVVHRDVKPANILLTSNAGAKLADFDLARTVHEQPQRM